MLKWLEEYMSKSFIDLSKKIDKKKVNIFEQIDKISKSLEIDFVIIGATARDIILKTYHNIDTIRATYDIDLAVQVASWEQFNNLKISFIASGKFKPSKLDCRIHFEDDTIIDIIPFGGITKANHILTLPNKKTMNLTGFEEAFNTAITARIRLNPLLESKFLSPSGMALMKLISWDEKYPEREKDAEDLFLLMSSYLDAGNSKRLYDKEKDLLEMDNFDYTLSGSRLLGRDLAMISNKATIKVVFDIINRETDGRNSKLVLDMIGTNYTKSIEALSILKELKVGILDRINI